MVSTGNLYAGLTWSRTSTTLTVTSAGHGLSVGDYVVIRNMSVDYSYLEIQTTADINTFTVTVPDSGGESGTAGAYIPAFGVTITNSGGNITASVIAKPSTGNVRLIKYSQFTSEQADNCSLTIPTGITNGAAYDNKQTLFPITAQGFIVSGTGGTGGLSPVLTQTVGSNRNVIAISGIGQEVESIFTLNF